MEIDRKELLDQYDRFINQVREEIKELYWLYNFFFLVNSALLGSVFIGKLQAQYLISAKFLGIILSLYWFGTIRKQWMWRNDWMKKIQKVEDRLGYSDPDTVMWKRKTESKNFFRDYLFGKRGVWRWMFLLPLGFMLTWIVLVFKVI